MELLTGRSVDRVSGLGLEKWLQPGSWGPIHRDGIIPPNGDAPLARKQLEKTNSTPGELAMIRQLGFPNRSSPTGVLSDPNPAIFARVDGCDHGDEASGFGGMYLWRGLVPARGFTRVLLCRSPKSHSRIFKRLPNIYQLAC